MAMQICNVPSGAGGAAFEVRSAFCGGFVQPFAVFEVVFGKSCIQSPTLCASITYGGRANILE